MSRTQTLLLLMAIVAYIVTVASSMVSAKDEDDGIPQCRVNTVSGFHVDLNPLKKIGSGAGETSYNDMDDSYQWRFLVNICGGVDQTCTDNDGNKHTNLFSLQETAFGIDQECFPLSGSADEPGEFLKVEPVDTSTENAGVVMTITGGAEIDEGAGKGKQRSTKITFVCDPDMDVEPDFEFIKEDAAKGVYEFEMVTAHACDKEGSVSGDGFDWAWFIFFPGVLGFILIFAVIGFVIYLIAGIVINKKKYDRAGLDLIPNVEFWRMLPGLWLDGILFIKGGISALFAKCFNRNKYQDLEAS